MVLFVLGFVVAAGVIVLFLWARPSPRLRRAGGGDGATINPEQVETRRENLEKVMALAAEKGEVTNDDVQYALKVSDATATRYLEELERQGRMVQVGRGKGTVYRLKYGSTGG